MEIINKIINYIRAFLSAYIFMPIHAWYSFYFHNKAILNNSRNQQALDYLSRLAQDKTIQPQTPVCAGEIALEMMSYMWVEEEKWDDE